MRFLSGLLLFVCFVSSVFCYEISPLGASDEVTSLPGLSAPLPFRQFSGYLDVNAQKKIHYWFFESQNDPDNDPVALWTNGGPGCSGLIGLFEEHGPFRVGSDGNLEVELSTSWNAITNYFYVEQPVGVGFSYSSNSADYRTGDAQAAADNLQAILSFFTKFPGLAKNRFIITSESYGGHYMPTLALAILNYNSGASSPLNFDGFLVGNPYTNLTENFIGTYETFCGKSLASHPTCAGIHANCYPYPGNAQCNILEFAAQVEVGNLDPYALDFPLCLSLSRAQRRRMNEFLHHRNPSVLALLNARYEPCEEDFATTYLNRADVQSAIHVQSTKWVACSNIVRYNQTDSDSAMNHFYTDIIAKSGGTLHMTVLSGDDDSVCGTLGTTDWMYGLGLAVKSAWKSWTDDDGQVGGYVVAFQQGLTLVTVHTAGHEVPAFQPERAFKVWKNFVNKIW